MKARDHNISWNDLPWELQDHIFGFLTADLLHAMQVNKQWYADIQYNQIKPRAIQYLEKTLKPHYPDFDKQMADVLTSPDKLGYLANEAYLSFRKGRIAKQIKDVTKGANLLERRKFRHYFALIPIALCILVEWLVDLLPPDTDERANRIWAERIRAIDTMPVPIIICLLVIHLGCMIKHLYDSYHRYQASFSNNVKEKSAEIMQAALANHSLFSHTPNSENKKVICNGNKKRRSIVQV